MLGAVLLTYIYLTTPQTYTPVTVSSFYPTVIAEVERSMQKNVTDIPTMAKPFFYFWRTIDDRYDQIVNWQKHRSGEIEDDFDKSIPWQYRGTFEDKVESYNNTLKYSYQRFPREVVAMISLYIFSLIAAIMIYKEIWVKCNIFIIFFGICCANYFQLISLYILNTTGSIPSAVFHNFSWTAPLFFCLLAIVFYRTRAMLKSREAQQLVDDTQQQIDDAQHQAENIHQAKLEPIIGDDKELKVFQETVIAHKEKVYSQQELDAYNEFLLYNGSRFIYYFLAVLLMFTVVGIPLSLWLFFRVKTMKISVLPEQIIVRGLTTKCFLLKDIADFAVLQIDDKGDAAGEGQGLADQSLIVSFFVFLFSMIFLIGRGSDTYILIKNNNHKTSRFRISSYRSEDIFIAKLEHLMGRKATRINDKMVKQWTKGVVPVDIGQT